MTDSKKVYRVLEQYSVPLKSKDLQVLTGLSDKQIRGAVRALRLFGVKVCSGNKGFWLWNGKDDTWRHTKAQIKGRYLALQQLYYAMENLPLEHQEEMDL